MTLARPARYLLPQHRRIRQPVAVRILAPINPAPLRPLHLVGLAARVGLCKRIVLSPELASVADMLTLSRRLLEHGVRHLQISWHSPSLRPGLSPFVTTVADVERLYARIAGYLEGLSRIIPFAFATVSEAAALLA